MAMKDIKSITVGPDEEESSVRLFQSFGWELKSTQEVKTQDVQTFTGQDSDGTKHYETKSGEHYIKLTFERDPERKNYADLKALEEQYYAPLPRISNEPGNEPKKPGVFSLVISVIGFIIAALCLVIGIGYFVLEKIDGGGGGVRQLVSIVITAIVLALPWVFRRRSKKTLASRLKSWEAAKSKYEAEVATVSEARKNRTDALKKAQSLV